MFVDAYGDSGICRQNANHLGVGQRRRCHLFTFCEGNMVRGSALDIGRSRVCLYVAIWISWIWKIGPTFKTET